MDGRVQIPAITWIKENYKIDYVDMITTPGSDKLLSENKDVHEIKSIKKKVEFPEFSYITIWKYQTKQSILWLP